MGRTILYVRGFHPSTRARDLAYEFERFGPLVRCDIPAPRNHSTSTNPSRDAETAFDDMHGRYFEGYRLTVEWAKKLPSSIWRTGGRSPPRRSGRDRSRSPRRRDRGERDGDRYEDDRYDRRRKSRSRERGDRDKDRDEKDTDRDGDRERRKKSATPERRRSASPDRRGRDDRARTPPPPPVEDVKKETDRARTPPYEN